MGTTVKDHLLLCLGLLLACVRLIASPQDTSGTALVSQDQVADEVRELTPGTTIERELSGNHRHSYFIGLELGQFVRIIAIQKEIDLILVLFGPDRQELLRVNRYSRGRGD